MSRARFLQCLAPDADLLNTSRDVKAYLQVFVKTKLGELVVVIIGHLLNLSYYSYWIIPSVTVESQVALLRLSCHSGVTVTGTVALDAANR